MTQIQTIQIPKAYRRTVRRRQAVLEYVARRIVVVREALAVRPDARGRALLQVCLAPASMPS